MLRKSNCNKDLLLAKFRRSTKWIKEGSQEEFPNKIFLDEAVASFEREFSPFVLEQEEIDKLREMIDNCVTKLNQRVKMRSADGKRIAFILIGHFSYMSMIRDEVMKTPLYQELQTDFQRLSELPE